METVRDLPLENVDRVVALTYGLATEAMGHFVNPSDDDHLDNLYEALDDSPPEPTRQNEPVKEIGQTSPPSNLGSHFATAGAFSEDTTNRSNWVYAAGGAAALIVLTAGAVAIWWPGSDDSPDAVPIPADESDGAGLETEGDSDLAAAICAEALEQEDSPSARTVVRQLIEDAESDAGSESLRSLVNAQCIADISALGLPEASGPEVDPWNPGDADDLFALAMGRTTPDGDLDMLGWLAWIDCRNARPSGFWDHALTCDLPVDEDLVTALYIDWLEAYDSPELDTSDRMLAAILTRPTLLETLSESACEADIGAVYVAQLMFAHDLVFIYEDFSSEARYDGADQVVEHVNRAAAIQDFDFDGEVEVLRC